MPVLRHRAAIFRLRERAAGASVPVFIPTSNMNQKIEQANDNQIELQPVQPIVVSQNLVRLKWIMALLVGFATGIAGCVVGINSLQKQYYRIRCTDQDMSLLATEINAYKAKHGMYPLSLDRMASSESDMWYISLIIEDAWGHRMIYSSNGETWELLSYGADGKPGGVGLNADITYQRRDGIRWLVFPTVGDVSRSEYFMPTVLFGAFTGIVGFLIAWLRLFMLSPRGEIIVATIGLSIIMVLIVATVLQVYVQFIVSNHQ